MVEFAECSGKTGAAKEQCKENTAYNRGAELGKDVDSNTAAARENIDAYSGELANDPHSYKMLKSFYEGMRSKSNDVHILETNGQLDVFIDYGIENKVGAVAGIIKQQASSREMSQEKAQQTALELANSQVERTINNDVKKHPGQDAEEYKREVRNRNYEREDFVRLFNEQHVSGFTAVLDKHGKVKIERTH